MTRQAPGHLQTLLQLGYTRTNSGLLASDGQTANSYDGVDRLQQVGTSGGATYGFDAADHLTSQSVQGGTTASLAYDAADQLQSLQSVEWSFTAFTWDPAFSDWEHWVLSEGEGTYPAPGPEVTFGQEEDTVAADPGYAWDAWIAGSATLSNGQTCSFFATTRTAGAWGGLAPS